jgi:hypothetical protein
MDLGISDMARPCTDNVKHGFIFYAHRSNNEGVGMIEVIGLIGGVLIILTWLVLGGEGDE